MPIEGASLREAAQRLCDELNRVLALTVTRARLVSFVPKGVARPAQIAFRQAGRVTQAPLGTRYGRVWLALGQTCDSLRTPEGRHRLVTIKYRYALTADGADEPLLRWEYDRHAPGPWCRHHLQGAVPLEVGRAPVSLNDWHLPTGYVTIEEVLRFCIADLGVRALSENWQEILEESYRRFKDDFAPR